MNKQTFINKKLGETYTVATLDNGLTIYVCPKPDFSSSYVLYGTKYGSVDTKFRTPADSAFTEVPEGIAHYLEHKLFESEDGDAFEKFSKTGAYSNAYTSFDRTCYLFSCTDRFCENLDILLDFVRSPYFTEQTVQKEQGIIGQEIRMYDDEPGWRVFFNLLCAMFEKHPVRIDIAGTVESIAQINADLLYKCYNTFYNPQNMFVCVCGPVDVDGVIAHIEKAMLDGKGAAPVEVEKGMFNEPRGVCKSYAEQSLAVSQPLFNVGFKEDASCGIQPLEKRVYTDILLEMIAGKSSELYNDLLEQGLVNDTFGASYFTGYGYAAEIFEGESPDPKKVYDAIIAKLDKIRADGIDRAEFERAKNALYGRSIMLYNSVERIASALVAAAVEGGDLFTVDDILSGATVERAEEILGGQMLKEYSALSVINPNN